MMKRTIVLVMALLVILSPIASAADATEKGMTRGDFFQLVVEQVGEVEPSHTTKLPKDVNEQSPYANAVFQLMERGILNGYVDGTVRLSEKITPKQANYILARFYGISDNKAKEALSSSYQISFEEKDYVSKQEAEAAISSFLKSDDIAVEWNDKLNNSLLDVASYHIEANIDMQMKMREGAIPEMEGHEDAMKNSMHMSMDFNKNEGFYQKVTMSMPSQLPDEVIHDMTMEQYLVPDGMFMKMQNPETGKEQWMKMGDAFPFSFEQLMEMQEQSIAINKEVNDKYFFYRDLGVETVDGVEIQKIGMYGKVSSVQAIMEQLGGVMQNNSLFTLPADMPDMSMALSGITWINKDTNLPYKQSIQYTISYGKGKTAIEMPLEKMEMKMELLYSKFNEIDAITVPEEAKNAEPLPMLVPPVEANTGMNVQ